MVYEFGSGILWGIPSITLAGVAITTPTPVPFGALQDVSVDISGSVKELFGQYQYPLAVARGTAKITGKAKSAQFQASLFNLVFGETPATGENKVINQESGTITGNSVTVANNGTFLTDLGVSYSLTGLKLTRGATASAQGIYSVSNGVYTFNSADNNTAVKISYIYTGAAAPGQIITINNQLLGNQPFFQLVMNQQFAGKNFTLTLFQCIASKLTMATKLEDWAIPEFDFAAMANSANQIGTISVAES